MAIDKNRARRLIGGVDESFNAALGRLPGPAREWIRGRVLGAAIRDMEEFLLESRPPVLYLLGRSGHGKSSLLNALSGKEVAKVGHVRPQTPGADPHLIRFEEVFAEWQVVDARGIFETPTTDPTDPVEQAKDDIRRYRPDVILHVVAASEARALAKDLDVFREIQRGVEKDLGERIPTVMVLTKADLLGDPQAWPPEEHPAKAGLVKEVLDYMSEDVLRGVRSALDLNDSLMGYGLEDGEYVGVVPVCVRPGREWNVGALADFIGDHMPRSALLDYAQALQREALLRRVSTKVTRRFSALASGIGAAPVPVADIAILTPLQLLLVALIGGLSCRSFSRETALEYTAATGVNLGFALAAREGARAVVKVMPGVGSAVSGAIAGATTYGIGKSAEAYFFAGELRRPRHYIAAWRKEKGVLRAAVRRRGSSGEEPPPEKS